MKKEGVLVIVLSLVIACLLFLFFSGKKENRPLRTLDYFDPKNYSGVKKEGHHSIEPFSFTNQYRKEVNQKTTKGKVYVTDFFFTTCQSICPKMSNQLIRVYEKYKSRNDFLILSHTVEPGTDSVPKLLDYAKQHGVTDDKWLFVTGTPKQLYHMARKAYFLTDDPNADEEEFVHTQNFALIDKEKHIRGYYDGTDSTEVSRLIADIQLLFDEYAYKEKSK
ncbi:MAG TPA: SCO family protein [Bacteroidia bacterium]|jgi:protein SCO1/2|nr:SCO family protein [Bacteroidia bacterium]